MTISQLLESVLGKACCFEGKFGDATPFSSNSVDIAESVCDRLQVHGFERHGYEQLMNGMTGEMIEAQIMIGNVYYQRLKHMVSDKLHCLDFETEVLTLSGWKTVHELTKNDLIATLKDEKLVYEKPIDIMIYPDHEGSMYYIKNQAIDLAVTGNHRMWVSKPYGRKREWQQYDFARADEIVGKRRRYKKDAIWEKDEYEITDDEINKVYEKYNLDRIFKNIPDGFNANVGVNGDSLSGGQKQIVLLLRNYFKNNKICILDEPTSALDNETRKIVIQLIKDITENATLIIITHDENHLIRKIINYYKIEMHDINKFKERCFGVCSDYVGEMI